MTDRWEIVSVDVAPDVPMEWQIGKCQLPKPKIVITINA